MGELSRQSYPGETAHYTPELARKAYGLLHHHARNGYERGDCHCEACEIIVLDLRDFFGLTAAKDSDPETGIFDPAALVRREARKAGWDG